MKAKRMGDETFSYLGNCSRAELADEEWVSVYVEAERARASEKRLAGFLRETLREADARIAHDPEWWSMADVARAALSEVEP